MFLFFFYKKHYAHKGHYIFERYTNIWFITIVVIIWSIHLPTHYLDNLHRSFPMHRKMAELRKPKFSVCISKNLLGFEKFLLNIFVWKCTN